MNGINFIFILPILTKAHIKHVSTRNLTKKIFSHSDEETN